MELQIEDGVRHAAAAGDSRRDPCLVDRLDVVVSELKAVRARTRAVAAAAGAAFDALRAGKAQDPGGTAGIA
ncbi:MAG: hypothetical protein OXI01_13815 [Albidovulum sp.]|nr:hypothetical protein [Albidovulum sp.]